MPPNLERASVRIERVQHRQVDKSLPDHINLQIIRDRRCDIIAKQTPKISNLLDPSESSRDLVWSVVQHIRGHFNEYDIVYILAYLYPEIAYRFERVSFLRDAFLSFQNQSLICIAKFGRGRGMKNLYLYKQSNVTCEDVFHPIFGSEIQQIRSTYLRESILYDLPYFYPNPNPTSLRDSRPNPLCLDPLYKSLSFDRRSPVSYEFIGLLTEQKEIDSEIEARYAKKAGLVQQLSKNETDKGETCLLI